MLCDYIFKSSHTVVRSMFILLVLQTSNLYTFATNCQKEMSSSPNCVCSISSVIEDFVGLLKQSNNDKLEWQLEAYKCKKYIQLPEELTKSVESPVNLAVSNDNNNGRSAFQDKLETLEEENEEQPSYQDYQYKYTYDSHGRIKSGPRKVRKRRTLPDELAPDKSEINHRTKRQVVFGVPNEKDFSDAVAKVPSSRANHQYIPLGSPATIQCFNPQEYHQYAKWKNKKYSWVYFDGRQVTTSQMAIDQKSGSLTIFAVQLLDTDVYNCTVELLNNQNIPVEIEIFSHQIDVISEPKFWLQMSIIYSTNSLVCAPEEIIDIQKSIAPWIHAYICENCEVRSISVMCNTNNGNAEILIQMIVTTFGIESKIPTLKYGVSYSCPLSCSEKIHTKILQIVDESMVKLFQLPILMTDTYGEEGWYDPVGSTMNIALENGCLSGFYWAYKLCFPCSIGQYSSNGKIECSPCPKGTYQDRQGSSACVPCLDGLTTVSTGSESKYACVVPSILSSGFDYLKIHWVIMIIGFILLSFSLKILIVICYFPNSKGALMIKFVLFCCGCCQSSNTDTNSKKESRAKKRKSGNSLLLTTDGYTTDDSYHTSTDRSPKTRVINELKSFTDKLRPKTPQTSRSKFPTRSEHQLRTVDSQRKMKSLKDRVIPKSQNKSKSHENRQLPPKANKLINDASQKFKSPIDVLNDQDRRKVKSSRTRMATNDTSSEEENALGEISNPKRNENKIKSILYGNSFRKDNPREDEEPIYQNEPNIMDRRRNNDRFRN